MISVAFAEEPVKSTSGQPMQLSLAELDDVAAGRLFKRDKKKFNIKVEVDIDQKNVAYEKTNVCGDDISGKSKNCAVLIDAPTTPGS